MWQWQLRTPTGWRLDRPSRLAEARAEDATSGPPRDCPAERLAGSPAKDAQPGESRVRRRPSGNLTLENRVRNRRFSKTGHRGTSNRDPVSWKIVETEIPIVDPDNRLETNNGRCLARKPRGENKFAFTVPRIFTLFALIFLATLCAGSFDGQAALPWRHYYRVLNQYSGHKAGRPERIRVGHGRYRMSLQGAELLCDFPSTSVLVSNVVWERADLGALRDLDQLYKSVGQSRAYAVSTRPNGSTLSLANVSPVDQGLYRCMATAIDPSTNAMFTLFQDIPFYPDFGAYRSRLEPQNYRPPPCCRSKDPLRVYPPSLPQTSTLAIVPPLHQHHHHYQHRQQSSSLVVNALTQY